MINAEQIRAARALLDWKTEHLSKVSGITVNAVNKIERGYTQGRQETVRKIQKAFEKAGIEFLPDSGVRRANRIVIVHEGEEANRLLTEDLYNTLQATGGEILMAHVDESNSINDLGLEWLTEQIRKRKNAGITHKLLVRENDPYLIPPFDNYRYLPEEFFCPYPLYIYGKKLALVSWSPAPRVVIIEDERFAESARKLFNFVWLHAKPVVRKEV